MPATVYVGSGIRGVSIPELIAASTRVAMGGHNRVRRGKGSGKVADACSEFEVSRVCEVLERNGVSFDWIVSMQVTVARGGDATPVRMKSLDWLLDLLKGVVLADDAIRREIGIVDESGDSELADTKSPFVVSGYELSRDAG